MSETLSIELTFGPFCYGTATESGTGAKRKLIWIQTDGLSVSYAVTAPTLTLAASSPLHWTLTTGGAIVGDTLRMRFKINGGGYSYIDEVLDRGELIDGDDAFPTSDFGATVDGENIKWNVCIVRAGIQVSDYSNELDWTASSIPYPASLFNSLGATVGWAIDPSDSTSLFTTITGTGTVTDTTVVGTVVDQSGLGWDFVGNANDSTRPTWDDANNALVFNGSSNVLLSSHAGLYAHQGATFVFAVLVATGQTSKYFFCETNSASANQFYAPGSAVGTTANYDMVFIRKNDGTNVVQDTTSPAVFDAAFHIITITDTGSQIKVYKDRTLVKTTNYTYVANTLNRMSLGALFRNTVGSWCNCKISRAAGVPSVLTGTDLSTLENWAATAVGITLP
jgi:hypothetical protein